MYIAREIRDGRPWFLLRRSRKTTAGYECQELMELGPDPSRFILYPGGNAFYLSEEIEDTLDKIGVDWTHDEMETLFWPYVRNDIKRAVDTFRDRGETARPPLSPDRIREIQTFVPLFDKRRLHYLRYGEPDPGAMDRFPPALFRSLTGRCRDEIEQQFLAQEQQLKPSEYKTYLFCALDLQRFFNSFMAPAMPHVLDQDKVDAHFIEELCRTGRRLFSGPGKGKESALHPSYFRYVIMFFDFDYGPSSLLDDLARDFMNRHRAHRPPGASAPRMALDSALDTMGFTRLQAKKLNAGDLTRRYRKLARQHHPDRGGSSEQFVQLRRAYEALLSRLKK